MTTIKQGADALLPVLVIDTILPDFSTAEEIIVSLYVGTKKQYSYAKSVLADHGKLLVDEVVTNNLKVYVERAESSTFNIGVLTANITATFANADFTDGFETKTWDITVGNIIAGRALDEII